MICLHSKLLVEMACLQHFMVSTHTCSIRQVVLTCCVWNTCPKKGSKPFLEISSGQYFHHFHLVLFYITSITFLHFMFWNATMKQYTFLERKGEGDLKIILRLGVRLFWYKSKLIQCNLHLPEEVSLQNHACFKALWCIQWRNFLDLQTKIFALWDEFNSRAEEKS